MGGDTWVGHIIADGEGYMAHAMFNGGNVGGTVGPGVSLSLSLLFVYRRPHTHRSHPPPTPPQPDKTTLQINQSDLNFREENIGPNILIT